jgi:hypothetical protein
MGEVTETNAERVERLKHEKNAGTLDETVSLRARAKL